MPIVYKFMCPRCSLKLAVDEQDIESAFLCPQCGAKIRIAPENEQPHDTCTRRFKIEIPERGAHAHKFDVETDVKIADVKHPKLTLHHPSAEPAEAQTPAAGHRKLVIRKKKS